MGTRVGRKRWAKLRYGECQLRRKRLSECPRIVGVTASRVRDMRLVEQ